MPWTQLLVVIILGSVVIFSDVFQKWLGALEWSPTTKHMVALVVLSGLISMQQADFYINLKYAQYWMLEVVYWGLHFVPWLSPMKALSLLKMVMLTLVAMIPSLFYKKMSKPFRPYHPPYWSVIYLWLIAMLFMVVPYE